MKKALLVALVLCTAVAVAQNEQAAPASAPQAQSFSTNLMERDVAPTYSDLYCAGFITNQSISHKNLVAAGLTSPEQTQYVRGNTIFVSGGGLQEGSEYSVLRELRDPNHYQPFIGASEAVAATGQPYAELGRIKVTAIRGNAAVADVVFSCQNMTVGDIVVPFQEHEPVNFRKTSTIERFSASPGQLTARIVMAREFDAEVARGQKVYINAGANKGVKVGDYFRAVRGYDPAKLNGVDGLSYKAPVAEDTQKTPGQVTPQSAKDLPVRTLGEMVVLKVTPSASTAMITNSLEDIEVGDYVELEGPQQ